MVGDHSSNLLEITAGVVHAYVSNNPVPASSLPDLIGLVSSSLTSLGKSEPLKPHIPIKRTPGIIW